MILKKIPIFYYRCNCGEKKLSNLKDEMEKTTPPKLLQISYRLYFVACVTGGFFVCFESFVDRKEIEQENDEGEKFSMPSVFLSPPSSSFPCWTS